MKFSILLLAFGIIWVFSRFNTSLRFLPFMPLIEVTSFNLSDDVKRNLVNGLAKKASEITGKPLEYFTVVIREVSGREAWGHNGKCLG